MSWLQYKKLLAGAADWVDLDRYVLFSLLWIYINIYIYILIYPIISQYLLCHNKIFSTNRYESVEDKVANHDDANYLYLVARGDAFDLDVDSSSLGLLGTLNLADKIKHLGNKEKNGDVNNGRPAAQVCAPRAGASGAKLLRIDTAKLLGLMEEDEAMADSIKSIVLADMQEKLLDFVVSSQSSASAAQDENPQLPGEVAFVQ